MQGYYCKNGLMEPCPAGSFGNAQGLFADYFNRSVVYPPESDTHSPSQAPNTAAPSTRPSLKPVVKPTLSPSRRPSWEPSTSPSLNPAGGFLEAVPSFEPAVLVNQTEAVHPPSVAPTSFDQFLDAPFFCSGQCPAGYYCPLNSTAPIPCPAGTYGAVPGLGDAACSAPCPLGSYCPAGSVQPVPCPAGRFGDSIGLVDATCSTDCWLGGCNEQTNLCQAGYFCPKGSISSTQLTCGGADRYCPAGSAAPVLVSDGYYTVGPFPVENEFTRVDQLPCEAGFYCSGGVRYPCPAGTFGAFPGLTGPACSGVCPLGHYCPEGSVNATRFACPAGRYGGTVGLTDASCSGLCSAGYYCPAGSISATQIECAVAVTETLSAQEVAQLQQSSTPLEQLSEGLLTSSGYTSFLVNNINGNYSAVLRSSLYGSNSTAIVNVLLLSQPNSVYCPEGAALPVPALPGFFTAGGTKNTRSQQIPCKAGSYCSQGMAQGCPAGRYGRTARLMDANCTGLCAKGYYCPTGSTASTQNPCPAGRYGATQGLTSSACSGSCLHPLDCPPGSVIGTPISSP